MAKKNEKTKAKSKGSKGTKKSSKKSTKKAAVVIGATVMVTRPGSQTIDNATVSLSDSGMLQASAKAPRTSKHVTHMFPLSVVESFAESDDNEGYVTVVGTVTEEYSVEDMSSVSMDEERGLLSYDEDGVTVHVNVANGFVRVESDRHDG